MKRVVMLLTLATFLGFGTAISSADPGWMVVGRGMARGIFPIVNMGVSTEDTPDRVRLTLEGDMKALVRWSIECIDESLLVGGSCEANCSVGESGQKRFAPGESKEIAAPTGASTRCYSLYADASPTGRATRRPHRVVLILEAKWPESAENKQN